MLFVVDYLLSQSEQDSANQYTRWEAGGRYGGRVGGYEFWGCLKEGVWLPNNSHTCITMDNTPLPVPVITKFQARRTKVRKDLYFCRLHLV